jgi:hypothetical protein
VALAGGQLGGVAGDVGKVPGGQGGDPEQRFLSVEDPVDGTFARLAASWDGRVTGACVNRCGEPCPYDSSPVRLVT